jgi:hypothetical protein
MNRFAIHLAIDALEKWNARGRLRIIDALREELAKPEQGWMPIESAKKYGDEIDIWSDGDGHRITDCAFGKPTYGYQLGWIYEAWRDSDGAVYELVKNPTHWMPVPAGPEGAKS